MRKAFTLVELLVVISIIIVLFALSITAIQKVRCASEKLQCASQMRQLGIALHQYHDVNKSFPCQRNALVDSWMFQLLPFIEQDALYKQGLNWQDVDNWTNAWRTVVPLFICPSERRQNEVYYFGKDQLAYSMTSYLGVAGSNSGSLDNRIWDGAIGNPDYATKATDITNGLSNTVIVGERPPSPDMFWGWWAYRVFDNCMWVTVNKSSGVYLDTKGLSKPGSSQLVVGDEACPNISTYTFGSLDNYCDVLHFWSVHSGGANWLMADGSIRFLDYSIECLPAMASVSDLEIHN